MTTNMTDNNNNNPWFGDETIPLDDIPLYLQNPFGDLDDESEEAEQATDLPDWTGGEPNRDFLFAAATPTPKREVCYLCKMGHGDCLWDDVKDALVFRGDITRDMALHNGHSLYMSHKKARLVIYRAFHHETGQWRPGMERTPLPWCCELKVKEMYPGDGTFVGFQCNKRTTIKNCKKTHKARKAAKTAGIEHDPFSFGLDDPFA